LVLGGGVVMLGLQDRANSMLVWKNVQVSQIDSNAQSSSGGRVHQPLPSILRCSRRSRAIFGPIASAGSTGAWP